MQKKIVNIQALRGIAVFFVIFYHIMQTEQKFADSATILPHFLTIFSSGVDLFFLISGFVIVTVTRGKFHSFRNMLKFLYNRVSRIYPLYWFYSGLVMVYFLLPPEMFERAHQDVNILKSFLLLPQTNLPLLVVAWTIVHEMYFYCIFALFLLFPEKQLTKLLIIWTFLIIIISFFSQNISNQNVTATISIIRHPLTIEFVAGCIIAKIIFKGIRIYGLTLFLIGIFLLVINHLLVKDMAMDSWPRLLFYGLPCALILYGVTVLEFKSAIRSPRCIEFLGDASYSIYLSHYLVLPVIGRLWSFGIKRGYIDNTGYMDNILAIFVMLLAVLAVGIGSYRIIEKPLLTFSRQIKIRRLSNLIQIK